MKATDPLKRVDAMLRRDPGAYETLLAVAEYADWRVRLVDLKDGRRWLVVVAGTDKRWPQSLRGRPITATLAEGRSLDAAADWPVDMITVAEFLDTSDPPPADYTGCYQRRNRIEGRDEHVWVAPFVVKAAAG